MDRRTIRCFTAMFASAALLALAACSGSPLTSASSATTSGGAPVYDAWTTPAPAGTVYAAQPAQAAVLQPAPRAVGSNGLPPPPPPPDASLPVVGAPIGAIGPGCEPTPVCPAPVATTRRLVTPERAYSGCWPPCNDGISQWHVRGVVGRAFSEGTDPFEDCTYFGVDVGRTFCGCWGLDAYYRYNTGRFDRDEGLGVFKDGGEWHHVGGKVTFDKSFGRSSKFYLWGGVGAGWFTTNKYIHDDSGFEVFGELGLGYNINRNWRVRAGVNVHGMDTDVTRKLPVNDSQSRWLWILAPVIELEGSF